VRLTRVPQPVSNCAEAPVITELGPRKITSAWSTTALPETGGVNS